MITEIFN